MDNLELTGASAALNAGSKRKRSPLNHDQSVFHAAAAASEEARKKLRQSLPDESDATLALPGYLKDHAEAPMPWFAAFNSGAPGQPTPQDMSALLPPGFAMMPANGGGFYMPFPHFAAGNMFGGWYPPQDLSGLDPSRMYAGGPGTAAMFPRFMPQGAAPPGFSLGAPPPAFSAPAAPAEAPQHAAGAGPSPRKGAPARKGAPSAQAKKAAQRPPEPPPAPPAADMANPQPRVRLPALPESLKHAKLIATATSAGLGLITMEDGTRVRGKMEVNERRKVETFIDQVMEKKRIVRMGDLAKDLRDFVNPVRPVEFFEKLVSRRKLKALLGPYMVRRWESAVLKAAEAQDAHANGSSGAAESNGAPVVRTQPPRQRRRRRAASEDDEEEEEEQEEEEEEEEEVEQREDDDGAGEGDVSFGSDASNDGEAEA